MWQWLRLYKWECSNTSVVDVVQHEVLRACQLLLTLGKLMDLLLPVSSILLK